MYIISYCCGYYLHDIREVKMQFMFITKSQVSVVATLQEPVLLKFASMLVSELPSALVAASPLFSNTSLRSVSPAICHYPSLATLLDTLLEVLYVAQFFHGLDLVGRLCFAFIYLEVMPSTECPTVTAHLF